MQDNKYNGTDMGFLDGLGDIDELKKKYCVDGAQDELSGSARPDSEELRDDTVRVHGSSPRSGHTSAQEPVKRKKKKAPLGRRIRELFPEKGDKAGEVIRKIVFLVAVVTLIVSGLKLISDSLEKIEQEKINRRLSTLVIDDGTQNTDSAVWEQLRAKYPELAGVEFPEGLNPAYALLYAQNKDFAGYIKVPGTTIDYPVVQGEDNSHYLDYNFYGQKTIYGAIFVDYRNDLKNLDRNTIIYGHNVHDNRTMFTQAQKYLKLDGYKESPVIEYNTPYGNYKWKIVSVFVVNTDKQDDNDYALRYIFNDTSDENFVKYIDELNKRTLYFTGTDILPTDKLLTLSTCTPEIKKNGRLVIVARMVREGESESVDVSLAKENPSIKYPQVWYDRKGIENPYINDEKWYP